MIERSTISSYIRERVIELENYSSDGSAFFFVMASAFIDFLSCAVNNEKSTTKQYRTFIENWFGTVRNRYRCPEVSLIMYCVMRNGLLHNFSFAPPHRGDCTCVSENTITAIKVFHVKNGYPADGHLEEKEKYLWIGAEPLACDIRQVTENILSENTNIGNIVAWCTDHPPLAPLGFFDSTPVGSGQQHETASHAQDTNDQ